MKKMKVSLLRLLLLSSACNKEDQSSSKSVETDSASLQAPPGATPDFSSSKDASLPSIPITPPDLVFTNGLCRSESRAVYGGGEEKRIYCSDQFTMMTSAITHTVPDGTVSCTVLVEIDRLLNQNFAIDGAKCGGNPSQKWVTVVTCCPRNINHAHLT